MIDSIARRSIFALPALALTLVALACSPSPPGGDTTGGAVEVPQPDMTEMEPQVQKSLRDARAAVVADPASAAAWGHFGVVTHAHELWDEAKVAYAEAEALDPKDVRWPYFLGDVLSVLGTDLENSAAAFRRAAKLKPGYAPIHMRLGRVLVQAGDGGGAAAEFERALELEPELQPARVALAQQRLADGDLEAAQQLLEEALRRAPRHAQALSTLSQVYQRAGRRDAAREVAERTRSAANYNLFDDPVMSEVVAEGVSAVQIWERARAFLDNGNHQQAALGLRKVLELQPENADAHQQLAIALGALGEARRARHHLERTVELVPDRVDALTQLATLEIDQGDVEAALDHLERASAIDSTDSDARWLMARAQVLAGDLRAALEAFDAAAASGGAVPEWARNDWGSALAQLGRPEEALQQFEAALAADPDSAQALFYSGLIYEGQGRLEEAIVFYCRSIRAQPNPPAQGRLSSLGRTCS